MPTYRCGQDEDFKYVLDRVEELVIKRVHGSGGYGMLVGPTSTKQQIERFTEELKAEPEDFIAQPTLALSTTPTYVEQQLVPRHVDLRPFCLVGKSCCTFLFRHLAVLLIISGRRRHRMGQNTES